MEISAEGINEVVEVGVRVKLKREMGLWNDNVLVGNLKLPLGSKARRHASFWKKDSFKLGHHELNHEMRDIMFLILGFQAFHSRSVDSDTLGLLIEQSQWRQPQGIPLSELQGLTTQVVQLVVVVNKLIGRAEEEKGAAINQAPLMVAATLEFQEIKCPTTSVIVYSNPSFTDSHSALNYVNDNSNSLMSDYCMDASVNFSECVCELYDGDESTEPKSEIDCTADLKTESTKLEVQIDFRKSKEYLQKIREAINHVLVLQYYEMDFYVDVFEPEIDFSVFDHLHDVPVEVSDFTLQENCPLHTAQIRI
ncbi:hypothetical protein V8G54_033517 [Vigna mungo]|uniref:Uncharacterized protein n=1 Tax=Vigna mungo TaxID=3915 RepID=A0AAQ3MPH6_VIGMU